MGLLASLRSRRRTSPPVVAGPALVGERGTITSRIPLRGTGEVSLPQVTGRVRLVARADEAVPSGTPVHVVEVLPDTSVVVQRADFLIEG